jgi:succinylglutamate desuccinylase
MLEHFDCLDSLPDGFFDISIANIREVFPRPTLIHLRGENPRVLFVSILLHGNESTGLSVMQRVLANHQDHLPHSIMLFVGNVRAAEANRRYLADQVDYNRCWPGSDYHDDHETARMMHQVFEICHQQPLFAAVDIHNNTGKNPHYACITDTNNANRNLAARFNRVALVFTKKGVSTAAFDGVCPALTIECGKPGDEKGIAHGSEFIEALIDLDEIPEHRPTREHLHLVESHATLNVPDNVSFAFDPAAQADLRFDRDFENINFTLVDPDEVFAYTSIERPLAITDENGADITEQILRIEKGNIYLNNTLMPAMITLDKEIVRQDCLCYLLQDYLG